MTLLGKQKARPYSRNGLQGSAKGPSASLIGCGYPHFDSPQLRQVMQLSIMTTAAVLHFEHS